MKQSGPHVALPEVTRTSPMAGILATRACGHCAAHSSQTWRRTGCFARTSPVFAYFCDDFDLVISDSTLCVVEKAKAVTAVSRFPSLATSPCASRRLGNAKEGTVRGRLVESLVSAPVHPAWGKAFLPGRLLSTPLGHHGGRAGGPAS